MSESFSAFVSRELTPMRKGDVVATFAVDRFSPVNTIIVTATDDLDRLPPDHRSIDNPEVFAFVAAQFLEEYRQLCEEEPS